MSDAISTREGIHRIISAIAMLCAAAVVIGSLGPWATAAFVTLGPTDLDRAFIVVGLGAIAGIVALATLIWPRRSRLTGLVMFVMFGISAGIGIFTLLLIDNLFDDIDLNGPDTDMSIDTEWGLLLLTLGAIAGVVTALFNMLIPPARHA